MKKVIKAILLILVLVVIFILSSQNDVNSIETTNSFMSILYKIYSFIFKNGLTFDSFNQKYFLFIRQLAHFGEFFVLGILVYLNVIEYKKDNVMFISIMFSVGYAVLDEIHQLFVSGRYFDIVDIVTDSCGVFLGILLIHFIYNKCLKKS